MPPEKESCGECKFYVAFDSLNGGGVCRRYPPVEAKCDTDWCGEFVPRRKPTLREVAEGQG